MSNSTNLTMDKPTPTSLLDTGAQGLIGEPLQRTEGPLKVSGNATYAAEYALEKVAYGVLVGSDFTLGKITKVDAESVKSLPGVIDVVTDFDSFARNPQQGGETKAPTQGVEDVAYRGEIVAIVVAESFEAARDAAHRVVVEHDAPKAEGRYDFETQRHKTDKPADDQIPAHFSQGDLAGAMAEAPHVLDVTYTTPSQNSAAMEPHATTAHWDEDGILNIYGAYQMPSSDKQQLAKALGVSASKVRIIARYIGGGFGSKLGIAPEAVAAAIAARQLGRPVKCVMARSQVFEATVRRSNTEQRMRLGADAQGKLTAIGHDSLVSNLDGEDFFEPCGMATHFLYAAENREINHDMVRLDWLLAGSMRAPGEAVGQLALECAMDELAEAIGIDPIELRHINEPDCDPETQVPFSSRQLTRCLDEGARKFGWDKRAAPGTTRDGEWLVGLGVAAAARGNMLQKSAAKVTINVLGKATVETDMTDIGTGTYTILGQIAGELLGIPLEDVEVKLGDTNSPPGAGSGGSWGAGSSGSSVYLACENLREQIAEKMGVAAEGLTLKDGHAIGDNRRVSLSELVGDRGLSAEGAIAPGKQEKDTRQSSYGAHFAEVGVNTTTGEVRVRRMLGVFAAGRILNEKTARSQCLGGMTFGIGAALTEDLIHDPRNGKLVNRDLAEYHVPVNADVPQLDVVFLEERDVHANPLHAKGIGELGISGAGAAIANAVYNACGVRVRDFPITLDKILDGLPAM
ncbi:xanthine dehydrogenase family protein molybdopterin-binding subunit [Sphingomonas hylomeconis]|uniref:Xanthine dehydrogenase family protein molybdopterin-binding subunit n=1 Tax=Sphingomonas hylomeconis TaxID=1395958 RepID=A0ABV7SQT9_9SPHN|nr:xanthine dehydrogenase family protein molybdopterin-binding subunit [Sphingomonas hylomeconis]